MPTVPDIADQKPLLHNVTRKFQRGESFTERRYTMGSFDEEYKKPAAKKAVRYALFLLGIVFVIAVLYWIY